MSEDYTGRQVLVLGLGQSGVAVSEFLWNRGAIVTANDHRSLDSLGQGVEALAKKGISLVLGRHPLRLADAVELIVVSPGVPLDLPLLVEARRRSVPVLGELELGFRELSGTTVAVTGTKGKSTTASLIAAMLRASGRSVKLAGNIGRPLVSELSGATSETTFVLEVSSFQLKTTERFRPHVAVLLDVTPDHLDWHPSFEDYVNAKRRLFTNQEESDWAVVFGGSRLTVNMAWKAKSPTTRSRRGTMDRSSRERADDGTHLLRRLPASRPPQPPQRHGRFGDGVSSRSPWGGDGGSPRAFRGPASRARESR